MDEDKLKKRYQRERQARQSAEIILEEKSLELYHRNQELEALKNNLELQVCERTKEAEKSKNEAHLANEAKSEFLANMSHEIRTPLTAIIGFADVLLQQRVSREQTEEYLTLITTSGRHLTSLLSGILDITKIENKKLELEAIRFNLPQLLQEIEKIYLLNCDNEQLDFVFSLDSTIPEWIVADPTRLKQIMHNLLNNAIKFTKEGCISLYVKFTPSTHNLHIDVVDTGEGIAADKQAIIFESFRQADTSITRNFGGTGLGLFITKNLITLMGGTIEVTSALGEGSRFSVNIVCQNHEGEYDHDKHKKPLSVEESLLTPSLTGNILLVEDTKVNQMLITLNLEKTGANVDLATNGQEGLEKALTGEYELILMDIQMPVMDGKEAMIALAQLGVSTPTYALTANVMPSDIKEYMSIGFKGALSKPLELVRLYEVLCQHLSVYNDKASNIPKESLGIQDTKLSGLFYDELTKQHRTIAENIAILNYIGLSQSAHIIKGFSSDFGYHELTDVAIETMLLLKENKHEQGIQSCTNLKEKIAEILDEHNH